MVVYIEFCSAIKDGDIGRIEQILKRITIMFQASNNKNYALELLRLRYNIRHKWTDTRKRAIFSSLLINTQGLPHRWIAGDLYQEFNNLLTKRTHATVGFKTSTMSYITPLIRLFHVIHKKMRAEYKLTDESAFHRDVTPEGDILIIVNSLKESNILGVEKCPVAHEGVAPVQDLMVEGVQALQKGGFARFVKRMAEEESDRTDNTATELEEALSDEMLIRLDDERSRSEKYLNSLFN